MSTDFSPEQVKELGQVLAADEPPVCPTCRVQLDVVRVPPRTDVSYVRDRIWLVCGGCRRTAVFDRPRRGA